MNLDCTERLVINNNGEHLNLLHPKYKLIVSFLFLFYKDYIMKIDERINSLRPSERTSEEVTETPSAPNGLIILTPILRSLKLTF